MMTRTHIIIFSIVLLLPLGGCAFGPVTTAVRHGDTKTLTELLNQGADVEEKSPGDMTPFMWQPERIAPTLFASCWIEEHVSTRKILMAGRHCITRSRGVDRRLSGYCLSVAPG